MSLATPNSIRACAFVVAGGRSSRMGQDKARLGYRDSTLLEHAVSTLRRVTPEVHILCGPTRRYEGIGPPVVTDAICGAGPIGGLYTALLSASRARHDRALWLAVDLPLVTSDFLSRLVSELDHADVVMARTSRGVEPLCAAFRTDAALAAVRRALFGGRLKLTSALDGLLVRHADGDIAHFTNVNTLGDYDALAHGSG